MRVAVVGVTGPGTLATAFARGAAKLGHEGILVGAPGLVAGRRHLILARRIGHEELFAQLLVRQLERRLAEIEPDVVLVTKGRFLAGRFVERLRRVLGAPIINYYPDHPLWPGQDEPEILDALRAYDEVVVWAGGLAQALRELGIPQVRVIPFGYDPEIYQPPKVPMERRWDIAFVGQCYPNRVPFAEAFADCQIFVSGIGWRKATAEGPLAGRVGDVSVGADETCGIYWRSGVGLNVLAEWNVPAHNMRSFEIPATGTVMVATRTPEHIELFGDDGAVLVSNPAEGRAAVDELLHDEEARASVAARGLERVRPHTFAARMGELLAPWSLATPRSSAKLGTP